MRRCDKNTPSSITPPHWSRCADCWKIYVGQRISALFVTIFEFWYVEDPILKEYLIKWKSEIVYSTPWFTKYNEVNLRLQRDSLNFIETKCIISAFLARIRLMQQNIRWRQFSHFINLSRTTCQGDDFSNYVLYSHL